MNDFTALHPSILSWQPLITGCYSEFSNITALSFLHWLRAGSQLSIGPSMVPPNGTLDAVLGSLRNCTIPTPAPTSSLNGPSDPLSVARSAYYRGEHHSGLSKIQELADSGTLHSLTPLIFEATSNVHILDSPGHAQKLLDYLQHYASPNNTAVSALALCRLARWAAIRLNDEDMTSRLLELWHDCNYQSALALPSQQVVEFRLLRELALSKASQPKINACHEALHALHKQLNQKIGGDRLPTEDEVGSSEFLFFEFRSRLLADHIRLHYFHQNWDAALEIIEKRKLLDPHCAQLKTLEGQVLIHAGHPKRARQVLQSCTISHASLETPYIRHLLNDEHPRSPHQPAPAWLRKTVEQHATTNDSNGESLIRNSPVFTTYSTFWTLDSPEATSLLPSFAHAPSLAWSARNNLENLRTGSPFLQHCYFGQLRQQLIGASIQRLDLWDLHSLWGGALRSLQGSSPEMDSLLACLLNPREYDTPTRICAARSAAYLGFHRESLEVINTSSEQQCWDATLMHSRVFLAHLSRDFSEAERLADEFYQKHHAKASSARWLISTCIILAIQSARFSQRIKAFDLWHTRCARLLSMELANKPGEATSLLLRSRFARMSAYGHHLQKRMEKSIKLTREAVVLADEFRQLGVNQPLHSLLARDNLFAAEETYARSLLETQQLFIARTRVEKLATEIEPRDPRVWMQVGEYRERCGDYSDALNAYSTAARLGPPYTMIAHYKQGCIHQYIYDQPYEAAFHFMESIRVYPWAMAPLEALCKIATHTGDKQLKEWSQARNTCLQPSPQNA